jgi:hypothetical protein
MKHLRDAHVFGPDVLGKWRRRLLEALRETMHPPFTPWWSRICVVQEVAVATRVEIVYGGVLAPWSMITSAASKYIEHSSACCAQYTARLPRDEVKVLVDLLQSYFRCRRLPVETSTRIRGRPSCCRFRQINATLSATKIRDRKASDPRDKVYALLGLVRTPQSRLPMIPDYSLSEVEVFRQATLECIYETGSLSIFSTELGRKFRTDLPSWVPDWGAPGGFTYQTRATAMELYNACSSRDLATETSVRPIGEKALQGEYSALGPIH